MKNTLTGTFSLVSLALLAAPSIIYSMEQNIMAIKNKRTVAVTKPQIPEWQWKNIGKENEIWKPVIELETKDYIFVVGKSHYPIDQTRAFIETKNTSKGPEHESYAEYMRRNHWRVNLFSPRHEVSTFWKYAGNFSPDGLKAFFAQYDSYSDEIYARTKKGPDIQLTVFDIKTQTTSFHILSGCLPHSQMDAMAISDDGAFCVRFIRNYRYEKNKAAFFIDQFSPTARSVSFELEDYFLDVDDMFFIQDGEENKNIVGLTKDGKESFTLMIYIKSFANTLLRRMYMGDEMSTAIKNFQ